MLKKLFGTKAFYGRLMALILPIMIQNGITNFVNMLDNVIVGRVGTLQMTGVAVCNQLIFVFNLCVFGAVSGAGIFGAQFFGKGDHKGLRNTFRFKVVFCTLITVFAIALFFFFGNELINLYLKGEANTDNAAASLGYAKSYLNIMLIGLIPYTLSQCYSSTLRETGQAVLPMLSGLAAVVVNLSLNSVLIFGLFGAPALGVNGAAIATVISRFIEFLILALWTGLHSNKNKFIVGAFKSLKVPGTLCKQIFIKGLPLMLNETLWAAGIATLNQCYSVKGIDVVAANNISQTFWNVFSVAFLSVGVAIGIVLGQLLGSGKTENVMETASQLITFSVIISIGVGIIYGLAAELIPLAYNTTNEVRGLATGLMQISALAMPLEAFVNAAYFTLRSGGKIITTFLFDSCFVWIISVPVAFILCNFTSINILPVFAICQGLNLIKCILGFFFVKKGTWIKNIVAE